VGTAESLFTETIRGLSPSTLQPTTEAKHQHHISEDVCQPASRLPFRLAGYRDVRGLVRRQNYKTLVKGVSLL